MALFGKKHKTVSPDHASGLAAVGPDPEVDYIIRFQWVCNQFLPSIADPKEKSVLVIGTGHGTEMLWCLRKGAKEVVGIDPAPRSIDVVERALARCGEQRTAPVELLRIRAEDVHTLNRQFDLVLSHNVFEHIGDVEGALKSIRHAMTPTTGRLAIFSSPLYYSSAGSHLPVKPWQHLYDSEETMREAAPNQLSWTEYLDLNKMTASRLLAAVGAAGLTVHQFRTIPDRNIDQVSSYRHLIDSRISTSDLTVEGIATELSYCPRDDSLPFASQG